MEYTKLYALRLEAAAGELPQLGKAAGFGEGLGLIEGAGDGVGAVGVGADEDAPADAFQVAQQLLRGVGGVRQPRLMAPVLISKIFPAALSFSMAAKAASR